MVSGRPQGQARKLVVGIADVLPRMIVYRLLEPAMHLPEPVQLVCHDDKTEKLLARLAINELDVVLSDVPASPFVKIRAYNHLLGECAVSFMGNAQLVAKYRHNFPKSLDGAPFLLPMEGSSLRRSLDQWFDSLGIRPAVRGEFGDCDLFEVFGSVGIGIFAVPTVVEESVRQQHPVKLLGRIEVDQGTFFRNLGGETSETLRCDRDHQRREKAALRMTPRDWVTNHMRQTKSQTFSQSSSDSRCFADISFQ
jgi:LysR family transcriptional activator of nhaA